MALSKRERVQAALAGEQPDRPPVSMWRHFYDVETTSQGLVDSIMGFQRRYDWDFMKVNPRAQYHVEDWGATFKYPGDTSQEPTPVAVPISSPEQWDDIKPLDPHTGSLGEHLASLKAIKQGLNGEVPFVMTVFNPISIAARLVESEDVFIGHMRQHPNQVHAALDVVTDTFVNYVTEILNEGADGIFFATTSWATRDSLTDQEYDEFARPYDLRVLDAAKGAWFNILHVCRSHNMLQSLSDYPVHAFNWDTRDATNPSLTEARAFTDLPLIGGVNKETLSRGLPEFVSADVRVAIQDTGGRGFMVGPSCSISPRCPDANLRELRRAIS